MSDLKPGGPTPRPPAVLFGVVACGAWAVLNLLTVLSLWLFSSTLRNYLLTQNQKSTAANKPNYAGNPALLDKDLHGVLNRGTIVGVVVFLLVLFTAYGVWHARQWSRWVIIALNIVGLVGLPITGVLGIASFFSASSDLPTLYNILTGVTGLVALATIVLLFLTPSRQWFVANRPTPVTTDGAPMPGFRGLFTPRPRPARPGARVVDVPVAEPEPEPVVDDVPAARTKAKVRASEATAPVRPTPRGAGGRRPTSKSRKA